MHYSKFDYLGGDVQLFKSDYLLNKNSAIYPLNRVLKNHMFTYTFFGDRFGLNELSSVVSFVNYALKSTNIFFPFQFNIGRVMFEDKLTYVCFESICYSLIKKGYKVYVDINPITNIWTEGISVSPIAELYLSKHNIEEFIAKFKFDVTKIHYRFLAKVEDNFNGELPSRVLSDVRFFLTSMDIDEKYAKDIAEVVSELVDNSLEHSSSDCLIDINVSMDYKKVNDPNGEYFGINIAIMDFSEQLLGSKIKKLLLSNNYILDDNKWYQKLHTAYEYHSKVWDSNYDEEDFFVLSAFQRNISSRQIDYCTGGTGLTTLISTLEKASDAYNCYVITGNHLIRFKHDFLGFDDNYWVGFNNTSNFISDIPDLSNISRSRLFYPGTAYNLIFVFKKG